MADKPVPTKTPNRGIQDPKVRKWLFGISAAAIPLLVILGHVTEETGGLILIVIGSILGVGAPALAAANVPTEE